MQIKVVLTRIDQILIGDTGMIHVVDGGGKEGREDLQRREHRLQVGGLKENMGWLGNVSCVTMIMVGNPCSPSISQHFEI